jgi:hypothetical protein
VSGSRQSSQASTLPIPTQPPRIVPPPNPLQRVIHRRRVRGVFNYPRARAPPVGNSVWSNSLLSISNFTTLRGAAALPVQWRGFRAVLSPSIIAGACSTMKGVSGSRRSSAASAVFAPTQPRQSVPPPNLPQRVIHRRRVRGVFNYPRARAPPVGNSVCNTHKLFETTQSEAHPCLRFRAMKAFPSACSAKS